MDDGVAIGRIVAERAIHPVFQPIVELASGHIIGVEALARGPAGSPLYDPEALFAAADRADLRHELDMLCSARALEISRDHPGPVPPIVFVNADPASLTGQPSADLIAAITSPRPYRIVLEFTERALGVNPATLLGVAQMTHQLGNALALDDVGVDPLSMAFLPLIEPEVVKLDLHLVRDPYNPATLATATTVGAFAERTGAIVLAEGIETEPDRELALALGATWGQGWLFGRPGPLDDLRGRPIDRHARLRPSRPDLHLPAGTPFSTAATRSGVRRIDRRMLAALTEHVLHTLRGAGAETVLLGAYHDPATAEGWLASLGDRIGRIGFAGLVGPALPGGVPAGVQHVPAGPDGDGTRETALVAMTPNGCTALCTRAAGADQVDLVVSHDGGLVHPMARMLMGRLRTTAPGPVPGPVAARR